MQGLQQASEAAYATQCRSFSHCANLCRRQSQTNNELGIDSLNLGFAEEVICQTKDQVWRASSSTLCQVPHMLYPLHCGNPWSNRCPFILQHLPFVQVHLQSFLRRTVSAHVDPTMKGAWHPNGTLTDSSSEAKPVLPAVQMTWGMLLLAKSQAWNMDNTHG